MATVYVGFQGDKPAVIASSRKKIETHKLVRCDRVEEMDAEHAAKLADGRIYLGKDIEAAKRRRSAEARIAELRAYLKESDWYAVRFADCGEPVPADVKAARAAARREIDSLRGA